MHSTKGLQNNQPIKGVSYSKSTNVLYGIKRLALKVSMLVCNYRFCSGHLQIPIYLWRMISVKKSSLQFVRFCKAKTGLVTYKDKVIYPSRSSSYFLKTSVILFRLMQLCTNKSKLMAPSFLLSKVLNKVSTKPGLSR
jgi:hypothetical protein